jgi:hypothetical protein
MNTLYRMGLLLLCVAIVGCASERRVEPEPPREQIALAELSGLLRIFPKPPTKVDDFKLYAEGYPIACEAVRRGNVIVIWGVTLPGEGEVGQGTTDIVAYEKSTPTEGGFVLLHNGQVKKMSAEEFKTAKKAK